MNRKEISNVLAKRLTRLRQQQNMTQKELADKIGQHPTYISHFETGTRQPSLQNLFRLCVALGCNTPDLLGF